MTLVVHPIFEINILYSIYRKHNAPMYKYSFKIQRIGIYKLYVIYSWAHNTSTQ